MHLAAVCGLYCGACTVYRARRDENPKRLEKILHERSRRWKLNADDIDCDGCLAGGRLMPHCERCRMRQCAEARLGVSRCADCPEYPCKLISAFADDGMRHHGEVLTNLRRIKEIGAEQWIAEQQERWRCPECSTRLDWYARTCYSCGSAQPDRLHQMPMNR